MSSTQPGKAICHLTVFKVVKEFIALCTGIDPIWHDICPNSCVGFTRPLKDLDNCLTCNKL
ncbi:hypothetical protein PAXRUDRAFT_174671 [Paxillus rubicundulus Ve08.2h10]|uniref:Uncharacterized protein n=1 Tax=Paxillus rubicundulus Ve08.2h10 TaxID=930991 RepID=A0A0D0DBZ0_9AGAM|nr:hypothetical protein PAXRUDRAFT_174671 [Paxillus rubicundulus Ve08.2h10]